MVCIQCGAKTHIVNSRHQRRSNQVWRRRQCWDCQAVFTTEEVVQYETAWTVLKRTGDLQPFSRDKLFLSLYQACKHRQTALRDAGALTDTVIRKLTAHVTHGAVNSRSIANTAQVALNRFDDAASVSYQAFYA